jgi:DNA-binding IclR family transcriptional regulator
LSSSTTYRLLKVLQKRNYVDQLPNSKIYVVGLGFLSLVSRRLGTLEIKTEAEPILTNLSLDLRQVTFLGVQSELDVMYLDKKDFHDNKNFFSIGLKLPLHCTALGKSLLMQYTPDEIRAMYTGVDLFALTSHTITDIEELIREVKKSKERGYSFDKEENKLGHFCIAAPIYDYKNKIIAAVSSSWDSSAVDRKMLTILAVKKAATTISKRMGHDTRIVF